MQPVSFVPFSSPFFQVIGKSFREIYAPKAFGQLLHKRAVLCVSFLKVGQKY